MAFLALLIGFLVFSGLFKNNSRMYSNSLGAANKINETPNTPLNNDFAQRLVLEEMKWVPAKYEELMKFHLEVLEKGNTDEIGVGWDALLQYTTELMQWKQGRTLFMNKWQEAGGNFHPLKQWLRPEIKGPEGLTGVRGPEGLGLMMQIESLLGTLEYGKDTITDKAFLNAIDTLQKELLKEKASVKFARSAEHLMDDPSPWQKDAQKGWDNFEKIEILRDERIEAEQNARHKLAQVQNVLKVLWDDDWRRWRDMWKEERSEEKTEEKTEEKIIGKSVGKSSHAMEETKESQ